MKYKILDGGKAYELDSSQKLILDLANGKRKPKTKKEKQLLKEIKEAEAKGNMIDFELD